MKRLSVRLLAICLMLCMLTGCGSEGETAQLSPQSQADGTEHPEISTTEEPLEPENSVMTFRDEDGSNNINNNCFTLYPSSYNGSAKTVMISDGESLYASVFINEGRSGIFKCSLTDTDLNNAQMVYIPDIIAEETFPIALGFLDRQTLCAVSLLPDEYNHYGLYAIAEDGSTTGTAPEPYCTVQIDRSHFFQPKIVGNYLYYTGCVAEDDYSTYALMRLHLSGEKEPEELLTYQDTEEISAIFDGTHRMFSYIFSNDPGKDSIIREHDLNTGAVRDHVPASANGRGDNGSYILKGYHDDCIFYRVGTGIYQLSLEDDTETLVAEGLIDYAMNFSEDAIYVIEQPFLYRIPYGEFGSSSYPHMDINQVSVEKFAQHEAGLISGPLLATYDPCLWFWNGQLWTFYSDGDWNNTLHVLPLEKISVTDSTVPEVPQSEPVSTGNPQTQNLNGMYCIGEMSDDAPAMEFSADTETVQIWNFNLGDLSVGPGSYMSSSYRLVEGGIEVSFPYGYDFFALTFDSAGFTISRDGTSHYFEKWG